MIQCLIYKDKKGNYKVKKEVQELNPELGLLKEEELLYVFYVEDYTYSPYARRPREERILFAKRILFKNSNNDISEKDYIKKAMETYRKMIYDPNYHMKEIYKSKINDILKKMEKMSDDDFGIIQKANKTVTELNNMIDKIDGKIEEIEQKVQLKGGRKLSLIEQMQRSTELYEADKQ